MSLARQKYRFPISGCMRSRTPQTKAVISPALSAEAVQRASGSFRVRE